MADNISVLISEEELDKRIRELGAQISREYEGKELHMICVLKGGVFFMVELAKRITVPVSLDFMAVSSYSRTEAVQFSTSSPSFHLKMPYNGTMLLLKYRAALLLPAHFYRKKAIISTHPAPGS